MTSRSQRFFGLAALAVTALAFIVGVQTDRPRDAQAVGDLQFAVVNLRAAQEVLDDLSLLTGGSIAPSVFDANGATPTDYCFVALWQRYQSGDMAAVDRLDPDGNNIPCDFELPIGELTPQDYVGVGYTEVGRDSNAAANGILLLVFGEFSPPAPVTFSASLGSLYAGEPIAAVGSTYTCDTEDSDCGGSHLRDGIVGVQFAGPFGAQTGATILVNDGTTQISPNIVITDDPENDGVPSFFEAASGCLDEASDDSLLDGDSDGLANISEYTEGTEPCSVDTDGDRCADGEEWTALNTLAGGRRNPLNPWDFYDVNGTANVDAADIGLVRSKFKPSVPTLPEDAIYDRSAGAANWAPGPPDNVINALDIGLVRASFNNSCIAAP